MWVGRTQIPFHLWSFHETKHHTNRTVVWTFQKLPMNSDVLSFLPLTDTTSVPLAAAGRQDKPGCQLILYDLLLNSFSTFKIKLWARSSSDVIQLLPIKQLIVWPCTEIIHPLSLEQEQNQTDFDLTCEVSENIDCCVSDASIMRNH